jgi:ferric-dicitrate binding protein FerR (iron transport regulator)
MTALTDAQRVLLTGYAIGFASGTSLAALVAAFLTLRARDRHRSALRRIEALSVALRACAAPRGVPLPPLSPRPPRPRDETTRYPVVRSTTMAS